MIIKQRDYVQPYIHVNELQRNINILLTQYAIDVHRLNVAFGQADLLFLIHFLTAAITICCELENKKTAFLNYTESSYKTVYISICLHCTVN